jgi:hypothetical protein
MDELEQYFARELVQGSAFYPLHSLPQQAEPEPPLTTRPLS